MASETITRNDLKAILDEVLPSKPTNNPVYAQLVSATIGKAYGSHVSVTAPTVSGYRFLCWAHVNSNGWVGSIHPANPLEATTDMWCAQTGQTGTGEIWCLALYIPSE